MLTRRRVSLLAAIVFGSAILALSACAGGGKRPAEGGQPRPNPMHIRRPKPIVRRRRVRPRRGRRRGRKRPDGNRSKPARNRNRGRRGRRRGGRRARRTRSKSR